jgi:hypothetical protein
VIPEGLTPAGVVSLTRRGYLEGARGDSSTNPPARIIEGGGLRGGGHFGRVLIRDAAAADEDAIRRRIQNVAARAAVTQPERRVVSVERRGKVLAVLTTSQKLAHRSTS